MPWFKVDDNLPFHAKTVAAGNAAMGLWVRAGAWSMQQLTDGFIPKHIARTMGTPAEVRRLCESRLWIEKDDGYVFHEWDQRQPSRVNVESGREDAKERQRLGRERAKAKRIAEGGNR